MGSKILQTYFRVKTTKRYIMKKIYVKKITASALEMPVEKRKELIIELTKSLLKK